MPIFVLNYNKALEMKQAGKEYTNSYAEVPAILSDSDILTILQTRDVNWQYVKTIKSLTNINDDVLSEWLNISVKTFRTYRQPKNKFKESLKEHIILLLSLFNHGIAVFGTHIEFDLWLKTSNFYLDNRRPDTFLNTVSGIRFVDDRLTAMEFGDNV
jgi:uncharacterized protein (DUF2384 family)